MRRYRVSKLLGSTMPPPSSHPQHPQLLPPPLPRTRTEPDLLRDVTRPITDLQENSAAWLPLDGPQPKPEPAAWEPVFSQGPFNPGLGRNNIHMVISPGTTRARDRRRGPGKLLEAVPNGPSKLAVPKKWTQGWGTVTEGWGRCRWWGKGSMNFIVPVVGWFSFIFWFTL